MPTILCLAFGWSKAKKFILLTWIKIIHINLHTLKKKIMEGFDFESFFFSKLLLAYFYLKTVHGKVLLSFFLFLNLFS